MRPPRSPLLAVTVLAALASPFADAGAATEPRIFTIAGGTSGDTRIAPTDIAALPDGGFLLADESTVRKVGRRGGVLTLAGTGSSGFSRDGGLAIRARIRADTVAAMPGGGFLIADEEGNRVREVDRDGIIRTVAGTGAAGFTGDGGPAKAARLNAPAGVTALPDGDFLIADRANSRIREVDRDGIIHTVAGAGSAGYAGDGGPATAAALDEPSSVAALPGGGFLIADGQEARVRDVDRDGIIRTVAGTGTDGCSGDGGPATAAQLAYPTDVTALPGGGFLIADEGCNRVREVDRAGIVHTLVGTGRTLHPRRKQSLASVAFESGDGGPLERAGFIGGPSDVAALAGGDVLVGETYGKRVRLVAASRRGLLGMALGDPRRDRVATGRYTTRLSISRRARVRLSLWQGRSLLTDRILTVRRTRWLAVSVAGRFRPGIAVLRASARTHDGAMTTQTRPVVLGGVLRTSWAVRLAGGGRHTRVLGDRVQPARRTAGTSRPPVADLADVAYLPHRTRLCKRFGDRRVDCEIEAEDIAIDIYFCHWIDQLTLRRDGQVHRSRYRCPRHDRPLFVRHPALIKERAVALDLSRLR